MARALRPRKTQSLSAPLHRRLNAYALAASAAGTAMLALAPSSEAEIVFTHANLVVNRNASINFDLNHDGIADFTLTIHNEGTSHNGIQFLSVIPARGNHVMCSWVACSSGFSYAGAMKQGNNIGTSQFGWMDWPRNLMAFEAFSFASGESFGPWAHNFDHRARYLGLQLQTDGESRFGWARITVVFRKNPIPTWEGRVTGYAYETIPQKPIRAGQTAEDDAEVRPSEAPPIHPASLRRQRPSTPANVATLGALALGADGIALWRREGETAEAEK